MAWNQGKAKENANPTILSVLKEKSHAGFDWSDLGHFEKRQDEWIVSSAEDIALLRALTETSSATGGRNVNLLKQAGLSFNSAKLQRSNVPKFKFSPIKSPATSITGDAKAKQTRST